MLWNSVNILPNSADCGQNTGDFMTLSAGNFAARQDNSWSGAGRIIHHFENKYCKEYRSSREVEKNNIFSLYVEPERILTPEVCHTDSPWRQAVQWCIWRMTFNGLATTATSLPRKIVQKSHPIATSVTLPMRSFTKHSRLLSTSSSSSSPVLVSQETSRQSTFFQNQNSPVDFQIS